MFSAASPSSLPLAASRPAGSSVLSGGSLTTKNAVAVQILGLSVEVRTVSVRPLAGNDAEAFGQGLEAVKEAWDFAEKNSRYKDGDGRDVIDGHAFQKLMEAIEADRDKFPAGEFTVRFQWADGAAIWATIPAATSVRVQSVSMSALFSQTTASGPSGSSLVAGLYREWQ